MAVITNIYLVAELQVLGRHLLGRQSLGGMSRQRLQFLDDVLLAGLGELANEGTRALVTHRGGGIAKRTQHAGTRRDDARPRAQQPRQRVGVQRTGATESNECVVARVVALLHRHQAQRANHVFVDDVVDAEGRVLDAHAQLVGHLLHRFLRQVALQFHVAAQLLHGGHVTENHVGVRHGGLSAALAVGRWARVCTGRLRTDAQSAGEVGHVRNGTAARTDGADVDGRGANRDVTDRRLATQARFAVHDERHVGGGTTHVDGQQVREARLHRHPQRTAHTTGRAGHEQIDGVVGRRLRGSQAAIRTQDVEVDVFGLAGELVAQVRHITLHARAHIRVRHRGNGALVFLHLRYHFRRQRDRDTRQHFGRDGADALLVCVVGEGVDERDGERLDALRAERDEVRAEFVFVQGIDNIALGAHALIRFDGERERRHGQRLVVDDPAAKAAGNEGARDLQHLAIALRGDETDTSASGRQHGVGGDRGAMHDIPDVRGLDAGKAAHPFNAMQHADGLVGGCTRHLRFPSLAGFFVDEEQVGESTTDVNTQTITHAYTYGWVVKEGTGMERE